jgi:phosphatidylglycerol:prolipoprotein diacylglycerol transferase
MEETTHWVHDLDPMLIEFGNGIGISWYGLAYIAGFYAAFGLHLLYVKKNRTILTREQAETSLYAIIIGILAGARIGYVLLYATDQLLTNPLFLFQVWKGGMSFHGGLVGVAVACFWIVRRYRINMLQLGDVVAPLVPPGLFFGRLANFVNGELWGHVSNVSWAIIFPRSAPGLDPSQIPARHPSQLYEATTEGLLLFLYLQWRYWFTNAREFPGRIAGEMFFLYAVARIFCEAFREPDASLILWMSRGTFYSLLLMAVGLWMMTRSYYKPRIAPPVPTETPRKK